MWHGAWQVVDAEVVEVNKLGFFAEAQAPWMSFSSSGGTRTDLRLEGHGAGGMELL